MKDFFKVLLFIIALGFIVEAKAQTDTAVAAQPTWQINVRYDYGFIAKHRQVLSYYVKGGINALELNLAKQTHGAKEWEQLYFFPSYGVGLYYADFGNPTDLGHAVAIFPYMDLPFLRTKRFEAAFQASLGLGWLNKGNVAIGLHLNVYANLSLNTMVRLTPRLRMINAWGETHFSNGSMRQPNLGLNLLTYRFGFNYSFDDGPDKFYKRTIATFKPVTHYIIVLAGGVKEIKPAGGSRYTVGSAYFDVGRQFNWLQAITIGADAFYDQSLREQYRRLGDSTSTTSQEWRYGLHVGHDLNYHKVAIVLHVGAYVSQGYKGDGWFWQRLGIRWNITDRVMTSFMVKAHYSVADFVEWGVGIRL